jgi:hypothetical protein
MCVATLYWLTLMGVRLCCKKIVLKYEYIHTGLHIQKIFQRATNVFCTRLSQVSVHIGSESELLYSTAHYIIYYGRPV